MPETYAETPRLTERFDRAMALALAHHRPQLRKSTKIPYVSHLLAVTGIVLELGGSEDEAIAALLHDAVEDGGGPEMQAQITHDFGEAVGTMVAENSDTAVTPKPAWEVRKAAYVEGMAHKSPGGLLVSLADKLHNARSITADLRASGAEVWKRFSAPAASTAGYYVRLGDAFAAQQHRMAPTAAPAIEELRVLAADLQRAVDAQP